MDKFRFEKLEIWKEGMDVCFRLIDIATRLDDNRLYSFADQLRRAALSITNNIAEGSGAYSRKEFAYFLAVSRRSVFECVNLILVFRKKEWMTSIEVDEIYLGLYALSVKIHNFRQSIFANS